MNWLKKLLNLQARESEIEGNENNIKQRRLMLEAKERTQAERDSEQTSREGSNKRWAVDQAYEIVKLEKLKIEVELRKELLEATKGINDKVAEITKDKYDTIIAEKDKSNEELRDILKVVVAKIPEVNINNIGVINKGE